jgi:hypothetical protein
MITKAKTRKAPAANGGELDPIFAAIAEHKMLTKESNRLEAAASAARDKAEKRYGEWIRAPNPGEWPGESIVRPLYALWHRAGRAESKAAMRMARVSPTTTSGAAATIVHALHAIKTGSKEDWEDWLPIALKTAAAALRSQVTGPCPGRQTDGH